MNQELETPEGWTRVELGALTAPSKERVEPGNRPDVPYLSLEHVESRTNRIIGCGSASQVKSTKAVFHAGDVLYGKLRPYLNKVCIPDFDGICSTDFLVFPKSPFIDARLLTWFLSQSDVVAFAHQSSTGISLPRVSFASLAELEVPLPPLGEQRRIVAKVEALLEPVNAARERLARVPAILKRFRQSVLAAACSGRLTEDWRGSNPQERVSRTSLTEHVRRRSSQYAGYRVPRPLEANGLRELPQQWCWAAVEELASGKPRSMQSGPFGSNLLHSEFQDHGILAIGIDNVQDGSFSPGRQHRISPEKYDRLRKYTARPLDVLVTVMGTVGRVCVLPEKIETAIITKHVYRTTPDPDIVSAYFLGLALRDDSVVQPQIQSAIIGQTRPGINGKILKRVAVPLPPLSEQYEIIRRVEALLRVSDAVERRLGAAAAQVENLTHTILAKAFRGELVSTEAELARCEGREYEPASVLLQRIRADGATPTARRPPCS